MTEVDPRGEWMVHMAPPTLAREIIDEMPLIPGVRVDLMDLALMILLEEYDEMTVGGVAKTLGLGRAATSVAIHEAIARGLLERVKDRPLPADGAHDFKDSDKKTDARVTTVRLTAKGMRYRMARRGNK